MLKIEGFKKEPYKCFSNMTYFPRPIKSGGIFYKSSENIYQSMKTEDKALRKVLGECNPYESKKLAKDIDLREGWDEIKLSVMLKVVRYKFKVFHVFQKVLLSTGDAYIEETNWWGDTYWGVCKGVGENYLGKILMLVREEIKQGDMSISGKGVDKLC